jgi:hypothetical protein
VTGEEYMLYGLEGLAALADNLFLGVLWEEASRVLSGKRVACDEAV